MWTNTSWSWRHCHNQPSQQIFLYQECLQFTSITHVNWFLGTPYGSYCCTHCRLDHPLSMSHHPGRYACWLHSVCSSHCKYRWQLHLQGVEFLLVRRSHCHLWQSELDSWQLKWRMMSQWYQCNNVCRDILNCLFILLEPCKPLCFIANDLPHFKLLYIVHRPVTRGVRWVRMNPPLSRECNLPEGFPLCNCTGASQ